MTKQIILIAGGSCSGKSVFATLFKHAVVVSLDHFYLPQSQMPRDDDGSINFDCPEGLDLAWCKKAALDLANGHDTEIPVYDMVTADRTDKTQILSASSETKFIVIEGLFVLHEPLLSIGSLKIYIDTPTELRVARRMIRDQIKGRTSMETLKWSIKVEHNHALHVEPTKEFADIIIPHSYSPVEFRP